MPKSREETKYALLHKGINVDILIISIFIVYIGFVLWAVQNSQRQTQMEHQEKIKMANDQWQNLMEWQKQIHQEKNEIEEEALKTYALYDVTKELTKVHHENEAFEVFKKKLAEHISFEDCLLLGRDSPEVKKLEKSGAHTIISLEEKTQQTDYLVIEGLKEHDREKLMILSSQFSLGIRRVKLYQEVERLAITDSLTNLYTRRYIYERLNEELNRSKARKMKMGLLMIDVDHFKRFNDQYGHLTGDHILKEIAQIIKQNIREIDIAGRFGGEEFCVVLPDTALEGARMAAERIRSAIESATLKAYDHTLKVTASLGVAIFPKDAQSIHELIDKADWNLYKSKKQGRNRVCVFED